MMNATAIFDLIAREQSKCERRRANVAATKTEIEVFGESQVLLNKLARQEMAVEESVAALEKLNDAAGKLEGKK